MLRRREGAYNAYMVYNHKRSGDFSLGGKNFKFRMVPDQTNHLQM